jgi:phenylacetate-CoA ligase
MTLAERIYRNAPPSVQTLLLNAHALRIARHRYGPAYKRVVGELAASEYASRTQIEAFQSQRLQHIVAYAYEHSSFYRAKFRAAGVTPSDIRSIHDIARLPLLTKEEVREHGASMLTRPKPGRDWLKGNTSGTTGSPLSVWYDRRTCIMTNAVDRRHKVAAGMRDGDWIGLLLGRVTVPPEQSRPPFWRTNHVHRQVWFSSFHLGPDTLPFYIDEIRRRRLHYLEGYPSTLFILARHVLHTGRALPMNAVITSSETLHPVQRDSIERAFGCRVFDFYALAERILYAGECSAHTGKHLAEEYSYVEIVDDDGNVLREGQTGYAVGTSLWNTAMPMIRYRTTDLSAILAEPCICGRAGRRVQDVTTKAEDIIITTDGRWLSPSVLTHPFKPLHQITASQILQVRPDRLLVKVVPSGEFTEHHGTQLINALQERVGSATTIEIQLVDAIPREASGKFRWVVSHMATDCTVDWDATPIS